MTKRLRTKTTYSSEELAVQSKYQKDLKTVDSHTKKIKSSSIVDEGRSTQTERTKANMRSESRRVGDMRNSHRKY
jgi:hypothetical protein